MAQYRQANPAPPTIKKPCPTACTSNQFGVTTACDAQDDDDDDDDGDDDRQVGR
jgi:hypothetical protein